MPFRSHLHLQAQHSTAYRGCGVKRVRNLFSRCGMQASARRTLGKGSVLILAVSEIVPLNSTYFSATNRVDVLALR